MCDEFCSSRFLLIRTRTYFNHSLPWCVQVLWCQVREFDLTGICRVKKSEEVQWCLRSYFSESFTFLSFLFVFPPSQICRFDLAKLSFHFAENFTLCVCVVCLCIRYLGQTDLQLDNFVGSYRLFYFSGISWQLIVFSMVWIDMALSCSGMEGMNMASYNDEGDGERIGIGSFRVIRGFWWSILGWIGASL